jgi:hypothetical protein
MSGDGRIVTRILAASAVLRAIYTANTTARTMSFNNGGWGIEMGIGEGSVGLMPILDEGNAQNQ